MLNYTITFRQQNTTTTATTINTSILYNIYNIYYIICVTMEQGTHNNVQII